MQKDAFNMESIFKSTHTVTRATAGCLAFSCACIPSVRTLSNANQCMCYRIICWRLAGTTLWAPRGTWRRASTAVASDRWTTTAPATLWVWIRAAWRHVSPLAVSFQQLFSVVSLFSCCRCVSPTTPVCPVQIRSRNMLGKFCTLSEGSDSFSASLRWVTAATLSIGS